MPKRIDQIKDWLGGELQADIKSFQPASNDASFRRYFRVVFHNSVAGQPPGQPFIVMDAPPEKENIVPFIDIATCIEKTGVHVPHLYAINRSLGFILMSDLGDTAYLSILNSAGTERVAKLYADAMSALLVMQMGVQAELFSNLATSLPDYDEPRLRQEMALLPQWYIKVHCRQELNEQQQAVLEHAMQLLVDSARAQPQVFVHRDYHSRNLMFYQAHNPGVIDFQDAVFGPITYDLVSLLRDSYIAWPEEQVYAWVEHYRQMLMREKLLPMDNKAQFVRWFDWMGIQRQLKVVGIFCRLHYRDGKSNYLKDIPQTLEYLLTVCARYPEFTELRQLLIHLENQRLRTH